MPEPAEPLKSSLKTVDHPDGGAGTAAGAAVVRAAADGATAPVAALADEPEGSAAAITARTDPAIATASSLPLGRQALERLPPWRLRSCRTCSDTPAISRPPNPLLIEHNRKVSYYVHRT
jgi:hypothetical protein